MQFDMKTGHVDRFAYASHVYPPCEQRPGFFATLEVIGEREGDRHPPTVCLFFDKPSDLEDLIHEAKKLRDEFTAEVANQIERERHQRESEAQRVREEQDDVNAQELAARRERQAAEVELVEEAERQMEPHHEDEHAPVG